jgi:predicted MPP superfamily phosphohydrolase
MICGHTHRGQVFPLNLMVDRMYEQSHGYRQWQHVHIWVSSGLSLWGPPFRIGTYSDLAVIEITGA